MIILLRHQPIFSLFFKRKYLNFETLHNKINWNTSSLFWDSCCIELRTNLKTPPPPLSKKATKAFIIPMKHCFQRNIEVLLSIARFRKLCNAPFCKSRMQHEKYNTNCTRTVNFWWIPKNIRSLVAICILQQWKCKYQVSQTIKYA